MTFGTAFVSALVLLVPGAVAADAGTYHFKGAIWKPEKLPDTPAVGGHRLTMAAPKAAGIQHPLRSFQSKAPVWPAAGTVTVDPSGSTTSGTKPVKAGRLPVWVASSDARGSRSASAAGSAEQTSAVRVQVASHDQALRAGADGMLVGVTPQGKDGSSSVQVVIDYSGLAKAYGGGFGSRLKLVGMPACALSTPQVASCQVQTPVHFTNRVGAEQLTAEIATAGASALAVTSGSSGSQGDYTATSLSQSGTWQTTATGAFTYSYPVDVPTALGGSAPSVSLDYDSQTQDGETSARNSQSSWLGDGWDYDPGFVQRNYRSCGSLLDGSGNKILKDSGDQCWGGDNATLSYGGHSGQLVATASSGVPGEVQEWKLQGDDGTVVQEMSGAVNGLQDGIYYRVLTPDGAAAYFGADHSPTAPGTSGLAESSNPTDASTDSAWGVPVLHPVTDDPCYDPSQGKASRCAKPEGWRWNLDFIVSPNGFVQRYDYSPEVNYYDLGGGQAAAGTDGTLVSYTRGGSLTSISYGYTLDDEQAGRTPAAQVSFTTQQRCQTTSAFTDCSAGNLSDSTAPHWPDVPWDLHCDSGDSTHLPTGSTSVPTNVCITAGPTFFTTTRLDSITTKVHVKQGTTDALVPVDSYQLGQVYSDAGGTVDPVTGTTVDPADAGSLQAVMWLQSIRHTGKDTYDNGNSDISLNQISFTGTEIDNRVNDSSPSAPPLYHPRISSIQTETGASVAISYNLDPCAGKTLSISDADSNVNSCYPVYWTVPGASKPIADWFNKTTVHSVTASDLTIASQYNPDARQVPAGSEAQVSTYSYSGPAWHRDDSVFTDDQYRTWDEFRGFRKVTVRSGQAPEPVTQTTTTYLQGMDGDYTSDGSRRSVSVDAVVNGSVVQSVTDADQLAGAPLETDTYSSAGGSVVAETVYGPFGSTSTASTPQTAWTGWTQADNPGQTRPALSTLPDLVSYRPRSVQTNGYALLADGTTWRHTETDITYDSHGRPSTVDAHGDVSVPAQEKCTTTTYADPASTNTMALTYPDRVTVVSGPCGTATSTSTLISDRKIYYDGPGSLSDLGVFGQLDQSGSTAIGQVTAVQVATGFSGGAETWQTNTAMSYDGAGRVTDARDITNKDTHTDFTPAWNPAGDNTNPTAVTTFNSRQWKQTSRLDPLRGLVTESTDVNDRVTDITYDALGRRTAVWLPGRDASSQSADMTFAYSVNPGAVPAPGRDITSPGAPSAVTTKTLREDGTYATSISIYDGLLQPRQVQSTASGDSNSGRIISDTFYDSHGWQVASYAPYSEPINIPSTTLFAANENEIPSETTTAYDGQGREVISTLWHQAIQQWHTSTAYPGADETDTIAPVGGRSSATFTNALGQVTSSVVKNTGTAVTLTGGQTIPSGTSLTSAATRLSMQADGGLVLSALSTGKQLWSAAGTAGHPGAWATFQTDGNFVVYDTGHNALWSSGTSGTGSKLQIRNDGDLALSNSAGAVTWETGTAGKASVANATTRYTYNPAGQVATIKDSAGNAWSYGYDVLGRPTTQSDPNVGTSTFDKYDSAGNLLQMTDPRGQVMSYSYDWDNRVSAEYAASWSATPDPAKEQASWTYDTLEKGYPTSSTRYEHDATAGTKAYTEAVTGYDTAYQPLGSTLTIPAADGFPAAGQSEPPDSGSVTYSLGNVYTPTVGLLSSIHYQADGGLPAEHVDFGYTQQGNLDGIGGFIDNSNTPPYLDTAVHDPFGRVLQANYGQVGKELATFATYDPTTGRTMQTKDMLQTSATALDVVNYRYDQSGQLTAADDLQDNTTHDTQCFSYDSFQRLTAAWTDTGGITNPGSDEVGEVGGCNTASVQTTALAPVKTTTVGGPAPYWQTYTYDLLGDRTGMVDHDPTGSAANDTTQSVTYAGADGTAPASLPNQATSVASGSPATGTATTTLGYQDASKVPQVNAGNLMNRSTITVGPLVSGIKSTSGGALCLADSAGRTTDGTAQILWGCGAGGQTYTIGTDGTVQVLGKCVDTADAAPAKNTKIVINTCSSAKATQKWRTTASGTLVNVTSGLCLADPAGNQTPGTQQILWTCGANAQTYTTAAKGAEPAAGQTQTFTYDAEGRTAAVSTGDGIHTNTSKYVYDADGNLLEQTAAVDGKDTTRVLYLFGGAEQITLEVSSGTCTALRNYSGPDGTTVTRSSGGSVTYQVANAQGTATTAVDAGTLAVTRRYYDPYGNPRGARPTAWVAPDENHGFLGQPTDPSNHLDLLGARAYDPALGRFLTPDPIFQAGDPNQMGGYAYAADNPASGSDPTGYDDWYRHTDPEPAADVGNHPGTNAADTDTSSGGASHSSKKRGGCHGFWGCTGHALAKSAPYVGVGAVVVVAAVGVATCSAESAGLLGPACFEGATATFVTACGAMMGDCGPGPERDPAGEEAGEDAGTTKSVHEEGSTVKPPTAGAKGVEEAAGDGTPPPAGGGENQALLHEVTEPSTPAAGTGPGPTKASADSSAAPVHRGHAPQPTFGKGVHNNDPTVERWPGGRPDGQAVIAGHGTWDVVDGAETQVPSGTWCVFYCAEDAKLSDGAGLAVEQGLIVQPYEVVGPGKNIRDLTISPARGLSYEKMIVMTGSITTSHPTSLSAILRPNMGPVHIATCREWC